MAKGGTDLDHALDELFAASPAEFTAKRDALAKELKASGDAASAADVKGQRKPTQIAWVLNQLARRHADDLAELVDVGRELARAQRKALRGEKGTELREAIARQRSVVSGLTAKTAALMKELGVSPVGHLDEVAGALQAALVDPAVGARLEEGRLDKVPAPAAMFPGAVMGPELRLVPSPAPEPRRAEKPTKTEKPTKAQKPKVRAQDAAKAKAEAKRREKLEARERAAEERRERELEKLKAARTAAALEAAERARAADEAEREADGHAAQAKKLDDEADSLAAEAKRLSAEAKRLAAEAKRVGREAVTARKAADRAATEATRAAAAAKRARAVADRAAERATSGAKHRRDRQDDAEHALH
jgi:hypothetical protein